MRTPCEMAISASASVCAASESCAAVEVRARPIRPRYALLSLMYAARVHANLHQRSRLSIIVEGGNTCQQCRTMGIPSLNCAQYRRYSRSPRNSANVFECCRRVSFLLAGTRHSSRPLVFKRFGNYVCILFFFFFPPFSRATLLFLPNRPRFSRPRSSSLFVSLAAL